MTSSPIVPSDARPAVVVPLRSPGVGKTRLADALSVEERAGLAGAMLADVAAALRGADCSEVVVAAGGDAACAAASALGLDVVRDGHDVHDLDSAVAHAVATVGCDRDVLVVAADLPCLQPDDVLALLRSTTPVTVAPTRDGGTGGLLRRPASCLGTAYGPGSARAHLALARNAGVAVTALDLPGFAVDVDTSADLVAARVPHLGASTRRFLATSGITTRLARPAG